MDHQLRAADVIHKLISHVGKGRFIQQELIGDPVYAECFRIHQPIGLQIDVKIVTGQAAVDHLHGADLNDLVSFVVCPDLVHTGGFGIENNLARNCSAHSGHLCQTYRLQIDFNYRKSTRDAQTGRNFHRRLLPRVIQTGGYGAIMRYRQHEKTFSAGYRLTTNNRMELMAAIVALGSVKRALRSGAQH